jgi:hypothetical protein
MAKAITDNNDPSKMFNVDVVAAVLMASGTTSLSMKQYEMMSALDGSRTASSFQHAFRAVLAKAKELKARVEDGETFEPVAPTPKRGTASPATPKKRKNGSDGDTTPAKKRATPKKKRAKTPSDSGDLPQDMEEFST